MASSETRCFFGRRGVDAGDVGVRSLVVLDIVGKQKRKGHRRRLDCAIEQTPGAATRADGAFHKRGHNHGYADSDSCEHSE